MVARIGRMDWGAGAWRTLRMKYRSSESVITPLTDRWQGPDRIAPPQRGRHLSQKSPLRKSRIQEFNVESTAINSGHFYRNGPLRGLSAAWRHGRQALLCALSAGEPCRQFVGSFSRTDRAFLSYNKTSLESLLEWLRSLNGSAGLRVWKDCRGQRRRRGMTFGTQKLRAGAGNASE